MKKILLSLALLASTNHYLLSQEPTQNTVPALSWAESSALSNLYEVAWRNPNFASQGNPDFDYYLNLLEKNIKITENRIQTKENGWKNPELQAGLLLTAAMVVPLSFLTYLALQKYFTGKHDKVEIPAAMLATLSSLKFNRAERKKLDRITVDRPTIMYKTWGDEWNHDNNMRSLTDSNLKNLDYLARRMALRETKGQIALFSGLSLLSAACLLCGPVYNAIYYAEYLEKQLQKDRDLYELLYEEKIRRQASFRAGLTPTDPDRAKRLASMGI